VALCLALAQRLELVAALGDELVFVVGGGFEAGLLGRHRVWGGKHARKSDQRRVFQGENL
jgi:hypothetical protein